MTPETSLGRGFWAIFAASLLICMANGASTPVLPLFVESRLGGDAATVGLVVGSSSIVAVAVRPLLGLLTDRYGRRRLSIAGAACAATGVLLLAVATSVASGTGGRVLFGLGGAAINTAVTTWIIDTAARHARGRALSVFGISIWIGLALGPQLGQTALHLGGYRAVWITCAALAIAALLCLLPLPEPAIERHADEDRAPRRWRTATRAVLRPGVVGALAWSGEGAILAFLVLHLEHRGLPSTGVLSAASVFTLFAISVIGARILLGRLPDRIGPTRAATIALLAIGAGLTVLAAASSIAVAAIGAVLLGFGFAPLYPALAMLATARLAPTQRATGLGVYLAFLDLGMAIGSIGGGVLAGWQGEAAALYGAAAAQLLGLALLAAGARRHAPAPA
ncbi:major facilitator superfamily MFS_1 [Patulibacter medicamentivorans]|uniref:Major facilitator superfamily MFS_1 n=1 Tax=Patulibacter medicamentivorans TaxID=1097667 RepID=H0E318_9ACTN|nr:MFS transporter [Patulibacter medicamentivorans]EHN11927.1 major facilitator superfamily MFS_1 [Patulibacter medicamentivorans]